MLIAAGRLTSNGYYDECLSQLRSVGEIANLLNLFLHDPAQVRRWVDSSEVTRRREYMPHKVRQFLESEDRLVPFSDEHCARLCEQYVNPRPSRRPRAHDRDNRPVLGAFYDRDGYLMAHWECCWALCTVAGPIAQLGVFPEGEAARMREWVRSLIQLSSPHIPELGAVPAAAT